MKRSKFAIFVVIVLLILPYVYRQLQDKNEVQSNIDASLAELNKKMSQPVNQAGFIEEVGSGNVLTEQHVQYTVRDLSRETQARVRSWTFGQAPTATLSAQGLDTLHHFVNSYLIGFKPFDTDKIWVPLYTLALRKKYQYDHLQYSGLTDIWQNSLQAYYYTRGDCEDHAIALADWLISAGHDARVVLGNFKGGGHAWVVLLQDGKEYIIEATNKEKIRKLKHYPLARLATQYHPKYQFNRTNFWANTGNQFTTRYSGSHWVLRSRFSGTL